MRYKNLSYLIGEEVEVGRPLRECQENSGYYRDPDKVVVIAEYPKTILVTVWYGKEHFNRMVSKSAMYCGDERIKYGLKWLVGKEVMR